jgi:TolA-binding protein
MKKLYILLVIALVSATCLSLPEDYETLIKQITTEEQDLRYIEQEIAYYSSIAQQRKKAREYNLSGDSPKLDNLFREQETLIEEVNPDTDPAEYDKRVLALGFIFREFPQYQDDVLFYEAKSALVDHETSLALDTLSRLLTQFPSSNRYTDAAHLAANLYFTMEDYAGFITIVTDNRLATGNTLIQYNLGNAYFNEGNYEDAKATFMQLTSDASYGFRAQAMQGLIAYELEGIDAAMVAFTSLESSYPPETPYYDFVVVTLARLYDELGDHERATLFYEQYAEMNNHQIDDELLYEIGERYALDNDFDTAKQYCLNVLEKETFSDYTIPARVLAYALELEMQDPQAFEQSIQEYTAHNDAILQTLQQKRSLLQEYKRAIAGSPADSVIAGLENSIVQTNELLNEMYVGHHTDKVDVLLLLETEYFYYMNTLDNMDQIITLAQNTKNNRVPEIIENEIAAIDTNLVSMELMKYYMMSPEMTPGNIDLARMLSQVKREELNRKNDWLEIEQQAGDDAVQAAVARIQAELVQTDLDTIELLARYYFQMYQNDEIEQLIDSEIAAMEESKREYRSLQGEIAENFNIRIARYMAKERDVMAAEFDEVRSTYETLINTFTNDVVAQNQQYQLEMLDLLFKYSLRKDREYQQFQKELVHE